MAAVNEMQRRLVSVLQANSIIKGVARKDKKLIGADFFSYNIRISALASGSSAQGSVTVQADSDFVVMFMAGAQFVSNAFVTNPYSLVQLTDTGTGRNFFNDALPFSSVFGNNGFPFILPAPRVFAPNTTILANVQNVNSAAAATYYMSFLGTRLYYAS